MENDDGTLLDEKQRGMLEDITEQATADKRLSVLRKKIERFTNYIIWKNIRKSK